MHHRTFACQSGAPERRKYLGDVAVSVAAVAVSNTRIWPPRRSQHLGLARHGGQIQHSLTATAAALPGFGPARERQRNSRPKYGACGHPPTWTTVAVSGLLPFAGRAEFLKLVRHQILVVGAVEIHQPALGKRQHARRNIGNQVAVV